MSISSNTDLQGMQKISEIVGKTLRNMIEYAKPGMSTKEIDNFGGSLFKKYGARSAPRLAYRFPGYTCISVNNEVAHGIPSYRKILQEGDLVNIDVSAELNGYWSDNGCSFVLGKDIFHRNNLVNSSKQILKKALNNIRSGVKIADIGAIIEKEAHTRGLTVIKNLVGHGVGRKLHEEPGEIPCYYDASNRKIFKKNSVVAIETFISTKASYAHEKGDGWTYITKDGSLVAQHEHTIVVTDDLPLILTECNLV